jgi:hypothetical protein
MREPVLPGDYEQETGIVAVAGYSPLACFWYNSGTNAENQPQTNAHVCPGVARPRPIPGVYLFFFSRVPWRGQVEAMSDPVLLSGPLS